MIREVKGEPYSFVRNEWGWGIVPLSSPTDRFHRSHQVYTFPDGEPKKCTCQDCVYRTSFCKHMRSVEFIYRENNPDYWEDFRDTAILCGIPEELLPLVPVVVRGEEK